MRGNGRQLRLRDAVDWNVAIAVKVRRALQKIHAYFVPTLVEVVDIRVDGDRDEGRDPAQRERRRADSHEEREGDVARGPVREELRGGAAGRASHEDQADPLYRAEVENDAQQEGKERHEDALREDTQERRLPARKCSLRLHLVNCGSHAKDHEDDHD